MRKNVLYIYYFIVLTSLSFYNPFGLISSKTSKSLFYIICFIALFYSIRRGIILRNVKYPKTAYTMLLGGIAFSIIMTLRFQEQSFNTTIISTLPYLLAYSTLYIYMKLNISKDKLERAIWIFCYISMGIYIILNSATL